MSVLIEQRGHKLRQHVGRVGYGTAVETRVQILVGTRYLDLHVGNAAQAACDRRRVERYHRRIGYQYYIGLQKLLVVGAELIQTRRADLLLAFEHELDVARQRIGSAHRLEGLGVHVELPLVVIGTAAPDAAVGHHRLERIGAPLVERIDRHHVVMAVDKHGHMFACRPCETTAR